jgi:tetratricopeptide (TPR) repeat protein
VMGDGIMALFGAPLAHEDHAVRACYAALRMQQAVNRYAEQARRVHGVNVQIRVGLNSGEVVVRAIGSDLHMDYTAVGQTTHLAARMEQFASPGSILLTSSTLELVEGFVAVKPFGPVPVKGLADAVEVYEVTGAGAARSRLQATAGRGLTKFVGRTAEVAQLSQALEQARGGQGQVVAVVGEPGVGKSRLYWEFTRSHRVQGGLIVQSASVSYGKAAPYLPVVDLLKAYFQIDGRDDPRKIREKVTGKLLSLDRSLEPALPALLSLLDVPVDDAQWERLDPRQRRQRIFDGVRRLLLRESQVQPLILLFEDLHWIDAETQAVLDALVESLPTARVLLLVNYRPEYQHPWGNKTHYRQLRIDPLPPESAEELLTALLGDGAGFQPLRLFLIERTEGNPLFLEETVRSLVETDVLVGERGGYRLARPLESIQVPATVQAILAARIDRLGPEDKRLLQAASVVGKDVPFALLQAIAEMGEDELRQGLACLQAGEFVYEARLFPDPEYTFKHALTQEVAYGSLLAERRRALHARIVEAIESLYPDRLAEHVQRLAHHALRGEVWGKAIAYLRQAGAEAAARSAYQEAATCFEQALAALKHLPENRDIFEQAIDLRLELRNSLNPLGEYERILDHLREAQAIALALDDQRRMGQISSHMANCLWQLGDHDRAVESGQRALTIAAALRDVALQVAASLHLGQAYYALGNYRHASQLLRRDVQSLEGGLLRERFDMPGLASVVSRHWLVWCLAELGEFAEGTARGEEGVRIAEAADQPYSLVAASLGLGGLYLRQGHLHRATQVLERSLELCQIWELLLFRPATASRLGYVYALSGRVAEALPLLKQAVEQAASMKRKHDQSLRISSLSETYLLAGRMDDAVQLAGRALELCREHGERGNQAYALRLLGEIAAHPDPPDADAAEDHYRQAFSLAAELGMRPLVAHCHLGLGKLSRRTGKREQAEEHLTTATTMYREMGMTYWLEKASVAPGSC